MEDRDLEAGEEGTSLPRWFDPHIRIIVVVPPKKEVVNSATKNGTAVGDPIREKLLESSTRSYSKSAAAFIVSTITTFTSALLACHLVHVQSRLFTTNWMS